MAMAIVYTIKDGVAIEKFKCEYEFAIARYYGKRNKKGNYYIAREGIKIPFPEKGRELKNIIHRSSEESQESQPSQ